MVTLAEVGVNVPNGLVATLPENTTNYHLSHKQPVLLRGTT